ncbi:MAG: hypothetical protein LBC57_04375 [Treponema sp.]|jgi:alpha-mannosidase|nr:hypothetical protein [Treponema sp.]
MAENLRTKQKLYLIGNAHIDVLWLWKWEEGLQEIRSTFASALDRIAEHGEFVFTCACAYYYSIVEKTDPVLFERIKTAVKEGRWVIVGGWWLQPDCNAPAGESFVRQGLYGQRYFMEKFGKAAVVGYNIDSFGHNGNLPQILSKSGLSSYVFMRPGKKEKDLPSHLFQWEGIDGSRVMAYRVPPEYTNGCEWGPDLKQKVPLFRKIAGEEGTPLMLFYGVGNHGGGPTKENLAILDAFKKDDPDIVYSDPQSYFEEMRGLPPVVRDELQYHAIGCYSSLYSLKKANNRTEQQLLSAEKMLAVLGESGKSAGADGNSAKAASVSEDQSGDSEKSLREGWKKILVNQFHDSLGGCSIPDAYPKIFNAYGWGQETASEITTLLLHGLASKVQTFTDGSTAVVWNPNPWESVQCIEVNGISDAVHDINGNEIPFELVPTNAIAGFYTHSARFNAILPPLGYTSFCLTNHRNSMDAGSLVNVLYARTSSSLSSGSLKASIDRDTGCISSIFDNEKNIEYLAGGIVPEIIDDNSDTWTHALSSYEGARRNMKVESWTLVSRGKVTEEYELVYKLFDSTVIMRFILNGTLGSAKAGTSNYADLKLRVIWNEKHRLLKLRIPFACKNDTFTCSIPYGSIERSADGREWPIQRWVSLQGKDKNGPVLAVLNDGIYSCSAESNALCLTLLRSPVYAHHEPMRPRPDIQQRYVDQGEHEFRIRLGFYGEKTPCSEYERSALEFNQEPLYVVESIHEGSFPAEKSFCRVNRGSTVLITAVKRSEDNDGWIIRAVESAGKATEADIDCTWLGCRGRFPFGPFEIKTLKISGTEGERVFTETNLLE